MSTLTRTPAAVNGIEKLEQATGFTHDGETWRNRNGEPATDHDLGWCAFYAAELEYSDLQTAEQRQGWLDAGGMEDYQAAMHEDAVWQQRNGWML